MPNGLALPSSAVTTVKAAPYDYELPRARSALVMIDFQRDFMLKGGFGDALGNNVELLKVRGKCAALPRGWNRGYPSALEQVNALL